MKGYFSWLKHHIKNFLYDETVDKVNKTDLKYSSKFETFCYEKHWKIILLISFIFYLFSIALFIVCKNIYSDSWNHVILATVLYCFMVLAFITSKFHIGKNVYLIYEIIFILSIILLDYLQIRDLMAYLSSQ